MINLQEEQGNPDTHFTFTVCKRFEGFCTLVIFAYQGQADLWSHYYHFGAPLADYSGLAASATTYSKK